METVSLALYAINLVLLSGLLYIYGQNLRQLKSKLSAGLVLFVIFFMAETLIGIYFHTTMTMYKSAEAEMVADALNAIKAVGFAILLWVSWE